MSEISITVGPMVVDVIVATMIIAFAVIMAKKGIYQCAATVVVIILSICLGVVGSKAALKPVYSFVWSLCEPKVEETIEKKIEDTLGEIIDTEDSVLAAEIEEATMTKAETTTEKVCHFILFLLILIVSLLILCLIKDLIGKVTKLPVVGWVNSVGGFIFGVIEAVIILLLIVKIADMFEITFFRDIANDTILFNWLISGDYMNTIETIEEYSTDVLDEIVEKGE